jgi:hypothetical protein
MKLSTTTTLAGTLLAAVCAISAHAADPVRIANEGAIRDQWTLADGVKLVAPSYPAAFADKGDNVCVALGYLIKPDGSTGEFALLKAWASSTAEKEPVDGFFDSFARAGAGALSQWRFKPLPEVSVPRPTYTVATLHFIGKQATDIGALTSHCRIPDMQAFVQEQKTSNYKRNPSGRVDIERYNREYSASRAMVENPAR